MNTVLGEKGSWRAHPYLRSRENWSPLFRLTCTCAEAVAGRAPGSSGGALPVALPVEVHYDYTKKAEGWDAHGARAAPADGEAGIAMCLRGAQWGGPAAGLWEGAFSCGRDAGSSWTRPILGNSCKAPGTLCAAERGPAVCPYLLLRRSQQVQGTDARNPGWETEAWTFRNRPSPRRKMRLG